ncbi:MAG: phospholipase [Roseiflexaceae bacterium]|nr:phospholipase [Roseiflexaceae bacterium]
MARKSSRRSTTRRTSTGRRTGPLSPSTFVLVLALIAVLWLFESGRLDSWFGIEDEPAPTAQTGSLQVYVTTPTLVYPDRRAQRGNSPLLDAVLADLAMVRSSVDLATFDLDLPQITDALISAKQRGAEVRVIVDSENLETPEVAQETGRLEDAGIGVRFDDRSAFMHNKFLVIDSSIAWTGSWNLTENDTFRNNNNMLRLDSREIALNYSNKFAQMFAGAFGSKKESNSPFPEVQVGQTQAVTLFAPEDGVAQYVLERIDNAQQNIRFMAFSFTSDEIGAAMIRQREQGIPVQGVFEAQNAGGSGSEYGALLSGGVDVLEDGSCYIMHHKTIIIDDRIVITGSYNFTASAEDSNDENLLIIDDPAVAEMYIQEFNRVFTQAQNPTRCG